MAVDVGKSWATIRAYELGTATPPVYVLVDIAQLVGRSIDDLLRDEQVPA